jgi:ATPase subunit of ABC transporter with duplicated ATPase domains
MLAAITLASATVATEGKAGSAIDWSLLQQPPNFLESYTHGYDQGRKIAADRAAARAAQAAELQAEAERRDAETSRTTARDAEQQRQERVRAAGRMIADGKCPDARAYALTEGDLDLAVQVAKLCPYAPP